MVQRDYDDFQSPRQGEDVIDPYGHGALICHARLNPASRKLTMDSHFRGNDAARGSVEIRYYFREEASLSLRTFDALSFRLRCFLSFRAQGEIFARR